MTGNVENLVAMQKVSMGVEALDNQTYEQTVQTAFQNMVATMVLDPQCKKTGISVPDSEVADQLLGSHPAPELVQYFTNRQTGQLYQGFADPRTGGLNMSVVIQYIKSLNDKDKERELASWTLFEYQFKQRLYQSKYFNLLRNGLYVTDAEGKQLNDDQSKYYTISYILKKYSDVPDNSVSVTDQDIQTYYNQHLYEYNQDEESRKIDYVSFLASPTDKDLSDLKANVDSITSSFKRLKTEEDSAFIVAESDDHTYDSRFHKHGKLGLDPVTDSMLSNAEKGSVFGPNKEGNEYKIYKVVSTSQLPDSAKLRLIAIPGTQNGDLTRAKVLADSLKKVLTPENFAELAQKFSQESNSAQKGGDMGWLQQDKVPADIMSAGFFSEKGEVKEIVSQGAYLLILAEDQSPKEKYIKVGIITKKIGPSQETINTVYSEASSFAGKHSTSETFEKDADAMNKRVADLKENDATVAGLQSPKELIRWAYKGKSGEVSNAFDVSGDRYVVAHIMAVLPMGSTPLELVKDAVKQKAIQEKKAQKLIADMKTQMQGAGSMAALGQKTGVQPVKAQRLLFQTYSVPGLGKEDALLGVMSGIKPSTLSQPFAGEQGVFVIEVDSVYSQPNPAGYKMAQQQQEQGLRYRVQNEAFDAMEKKSGFVSHLGKFY
jgi:peptidyl-prolyl cis-trans isomerase D